MTISILGCGWFGLPLGARLALDGHRVKVLNAVAPHHPTRSAFYTAAARSIGEPVPDFVMDNPNWKVVHSRYAGPLLQYQYMVDDWFQWLAGEQDRGG